MCDVSHSLGSRPPAVWNGKSAALGVSVAYYSEIIPQMAITLKIMPAYVTYQGLFVSMYIVHVCVVLPMIMGCGVDGSSSSCPYKATSSAIH